MAVEVLGRFAVDLPCGSFDAVHVLTRFDHIEVDFHDTPLVPESLDQEGIIGFDCFARPGTRREAKNVLCGLLRYGAASADAAPFAVLVERLVDGVPVETAVGEEIVVFGGDHCPYHREVDAVQRHPVRLHGEPLVREVFYQAEHLERSHSDGYHPGDEHRTHREREEEDRQIYKQPSEVSHLGIFRFTDRAGFWPEARRFRLQK